MYYELYLDSYFLLHFILCYFTLLQTERILEYNKKTMRRVGGAALGAALSCILLLLPYIPAVLKEIAGTFFISLVAAGVVFRIRERKQYAKTVAVLYMAAFLLGGILLWIRGMLKIFGQKELPLWGIFAVTAIVSKIAKKVIEGYHKKTVRKIVTVRLKEGEKSISLQALLDTGNSLREPFSGKPVCVTELKVLETVISREEMEKNPEKKRIIPYHSIGKSHGIMQGYEIENMIVCTERGADMTINKAVIGISENNIATNGAYQMILNPEVLKDRK